MNWRETAKIVSTASNGEEIFQKCFIYNLAALLLGFN
jgi:hypothetical protein